MKLCRSCNTEKDESEFGKRAASNDGLSAKCKDCQREYDKLRNNAPHRIKARAEYAKTESGIESIERAKKKWASLNKGKIYESTKSYRERHPKKYKAHGKIAYEIKVGNLFPEPCEVCFSTHDLHAHHDDYDKPLKIRWLCSKCHNKWHRENGEGLNAN